MKQTVGRSGLGLLIAVVLLLAGCTSLQTHLEKRDAERYPPPGILVDVTGTKLHLRCEGTGQPTVLMFSGSGAPAVVSYELQDRVSQHTRTCSYDRAGLGWSERSGIEQGLNAVSDDLIELLDNAGEQGPFILAPESYGGMIALLFASSRPADIAGLVMIDSSEPELWFEKTGETLGAWSRNTTWMQFAWRTGLVRVFLKYGQPDWIADMAPENQIWFRAMYSRRMPGYGEVGPAYRLTDREAYSGLNPGSLEDTPMIVLVHGKVTNMLSPEFEGGWLDAQQRLAALSNVSQLVVAEHLGHAMVGQDPDFVAEHILRMVEDVRASHSDGDGDPIE